MAPKIISLHLPKCAGTSLLQAFQQSFGPGKVYVDYGCSPLNPASVVSIDPHHYFEQHRQQAFIDSMSGYDVVHGHFHPRKFEVFEDAITFTVLRHPVERLISHYKYWLRPWPLSHPITSHPIRKYLLDEKLSIYRFAELPAFKYFYSKTFLGDVSKDYFDAVFDYRNMDKMVEWFAARSISLALPHVNKAPKQQAFSYDATSIDRDRLQQSLSDDIEFYEDWCDGKSC